MVLAELARQYRIEAAACVCYFQWTNGICVSCREGAHVHTNGSARTPARGNRRAVAAEKRVGIDPFVPRVGNVRKRSSRLRMRARFGEATRSVFDHFRFRDWVLEEDLLATPRLSCPYLLSVSISPTAVEPPVTARMAAKICFDRSLQVRIHSGGEVATVELYLTPVAGQRF